MAVCVDFSFFATFGYLCDVYVCQYVTICCFQVKMLVDLSYMGHWFRHLRVQFSSICHVLITSKPRAVCPRYACSPLFSRHLPLFSHMLPRPCTPVLACLFIIVHEGRMNTFLATPCQILCRACARTRILLLCRDLRRTRC